MQVWLGMETSLHRALKQIYATPGSRTEALVRGYRADVLSDGLVVEIQSSPLGAISRKIADLVRDHRVLVVKPITRRKLLLRQSAVGGPWDVRRMSPKTGRLLDVFNDLVRFTRAFPHPNLAIEVVLVDEQEYRVPRRRRSRRPLFRAQDRQLVEIISRTRLSTIGDLVRLLPAGSPSPFTTRTLADHLQSPVWFAQRVAYTLRHCGAARVTGKQRNRWVYEWICSGPDLMVAC